MTCKSRSRTLLRKTNIRRTRSTPRTHDAFTRVVTASHLRSPPHLHPHVRRVSFEVRHHSSRSRPPVVVAFPARADVVFFFTTHRAPRRRRGDETSTPRVRRGVLRVHARGRACTSPRNRGGIPPASSLDLIHRRVLRSDKSRDASHLFCRDSARTSADRATLFRRFPRRASGPTQPRDPSRRGIASRRRSTRARPPVGPGSSRARPCSPRRRSIVATRDPIAQSKKKRAGNIRGRYSLGRKDRRNDGSVLFFFWFGLGLPNGRGLLTKHAPRISDLRVRVSSSSFHRTPIARTQ